ncbi:MAG: ATP-binding protein [Bacteroidota bacterium]
MGQSSLALKKLSEESPAVSNITRAIKASERAADLTKQLLAYSGRGKFLMETVDLNLLVRENISILEVSVTKTAELRYELCNPSPCIIADSGQIQQVIMNLIINASDAMGTKPGVITVRTNSIELSRDDSKYSEYTHNPLAPGSYAKIQVRDTGSGISQETLTRIFDPFFTTKFTGRGLGLAAVLGIIKGHKGGLRIESEVGKGTMFEIVWPLVEASTISNITEKKEIEINGEGKTILVIDDEFTVIELVNDV